MGFFFLSIYLHEILDFNIIRAKSYKLDVSDVIQAAVIFIITLVVLLFVKQFIIRISVKRKINKADVFPIYILIKYLVWVGAILFILQSLNINVTVLLTSSAALFVGIGFGLQDTFKNIISGIILLLTSKVKIGDNVKMNGVEGKFVAIHLSVSEIETLQGYYIFVPNNKILSDNIVNFSYNRSPNTYSITIGVAYNSDLRLVKKIFEECLQQMTEIEKENQGMILDDFGDNAIIFKIYFSLVDHTIYKRKSGELRELISDAFAKNNITIPFPQRDIHIIQ